MNEFFLLPLSRGIDGFGRSWGGRNCRNRDRYNLVMSNGVVIVFRRGWSVDFIRLMDELHAAGTVSNVYGMNSHLGYSEMM